jgi:hypothetical protein
MVAYTPLPPQEDRPAKTRKTRSQIQTEIMPRWLRINGAVRYSGLSRAKIYELISRGEIKTAVVRSRPDNERGIRLLDRYDIDHFVNAQIDHAAARLRREQQQLLEQRKQLNQEQNRIAREEARLERELENLSPK